MVVIKYHDLKQFNREKFISFAKGESAMTKEAWQQEVRAESGEISSSSINVKQGELEVG